VCVCVCVCAFVSLQGLGPNHVLQMRLENIALRKHNLSVVCLVWRVA